MHPFTGMIKNADQPAAILAAKPFRNRRDFFLRRFLSRRIMQVHPRIISAHVINIQRARVPKGLFIQPHVRAFIDVTRHPMRRDADLLETRDRLRRP